VVYRGVSLFSGAGGMDIGFRNAGVDVVWANDFNADACSTYAQNLGGAIHCGDIMALIPELADYRGAELVFGGPPCQGFSVAGKMDPTDSRSQLIWRFADVVEVVRPCGFVMENVKALAALSRWGRVRMSLVARLRSLGYDCRIVVLNASDFGVPQNRERMFMFGIRSDVGRLHGIEQLLCGFHESAPTVGDVVRSLGRAGSAHNPGVCRARVTLADNPVLRRSPYAGMLFNGQGRPLRSAGISSTLPATMGGNRTPIVDDREIFDGDESWVEAYHRYLMDGGSPKEYPGGVPPWLRRLTVQEARQLQTFPDTYVFSGTQSSVYRQIGNAVPCRLAEAVGSVAVALLAANSK